MTTLTVSTFLSSYVSKLTYNLQACDGLGGGQRSLSALLVSNESGSEFEFG